MNVEKEIIKELRLVLNNSKLKTTDLQVWSNSEEAVRWGLRESKEVYVTCFVLNMIWHCAVLKSADKRKKENQNGKSE